MSPSSKGVNYAPDVTRLPSSVVPKRYELKLDVEPQLKSYVGQVNIRIFVQSDENFDNTIWLHSKALTILSASIQFSQFAMPIEAKEVIEVPEKCCIGIHFGNDVKLLAGIRAWLHIDFKGKLSQNLEGFFTNPYRDKDGNFR